ncbi:MAG: DUF2461 domain-containing protein [Bryobacteraceae bacterium]
MRSGFQGFSREAFEFFRGLEKNNRREWFQPRKELFETHLRAPMLDLVTVVNAELARFAPDYIVDPPKSLYRIYRDTRFSSDKTPYKTHIAAMFWRRGLDKKTGAGLYFSVSHKEVEIAGGVYMPGPEQLGAIRNRLAERYEQFRKLTGSKKLRNLMGELRGDQLSRVPKGFPSDHPAADLLRGKQWYYYVLLDPGAAASPAIVKEIATRFRAMAPLVDFLNAPLLARPKADFASMLF